VKVAYIGDIINHGKSLQTIGTSVIVLLSILKEVESIDVFCPNENEKVEHFELPHKVKINEFYRYDDAISILRFLRINWNNYDQVIFNILPTGFGNGTLSNALALIVPIALRIIFKQENIKVIYHNSVFTNNIRALGYNSVIDRIRYIFLRMVERILFKNVTTFVLLNLYKQKIDDSIGKSKVNFLNGRYLEAAATLYLNEQMDIENLEVEEKETPTILMHGYWGPQKNIELGLSELKKLKENGAEFRLVISGGLNHHFPEYEAKFLELLHSYSDIIDKYLGPVPEKDIMKIFLNANLLLLPYNTPGGHSGVLEQAIFFEIPTIAIDFPEYREQAMGTENVIFKSVGELNSNLLNKHLMIHSKLKIKVRNKIQESVRNIQDILNIP
jgi:glycosyltransferase involved in cell wall biosynthesis